jgi:hypothetical protein
MIEHGEPRAAPRVLDANYFHFGGLLEPINWNNFTVVVEGSDPHYLTGADVYEPVGVNRPVVVADVERTVGENNLNVGIERAVVVSELEASRQRKPLSAYDVGEPHDGARHPRTGMQDLPRNERISAGALISAGPNDAVRRKSPVIVDRTGYRSAGRDRNNSVGLGERGYDGRTRRYSLAVRVRVVARVRRSAIAAGAGHSREHDYSKADKPAEHFLAVKKV